MIKTKEFFALLLLVVSGEMFERKVAFEKVLDDILCKDDSCLFGIPMGSPVVCSIVCITHDLCRGFFYNNMTKRCTGSSTTLTDSGTFGTSIGTSFYQVSSSENKTLSAEIETDVQTTVLSKSTTEDDSQNKMETSSPQPSQQTSTSWKTSQSQSSRQTSVLTSEQMTTSGQPFVHDLWTTRNTSAYSFVFGLTFFKVTLKCSILAAGGDVVRIEDIGENIFLQNLLIDKDLDAAFIGYIYDTKTMKLRYSDNGKPAEFDDPWQEDGTPERLCVTLTSRGTWQSLSCEEIFPTICEKPVM